MFGLNGTVKACRNRQPYSLLQDLECPGILEENSEACGQVVRVIEQQAHDVVKQISRKSKNIEIVTFTLIAQLICNPISNVTSDQVQLIVKLISPGEYCLFASFKRLIFELLISAVWGGHGYGHKHSSDIDYQMRNLTLRLPDKMKSSDSKFQDLLSTFLTVYVDVEIQEHLNNSSLFLKCQIIIRILLIAR